ncbi:uncharacterized protein LOC124484521 [Hypomesus transpacificus]|uniref:uncharacterized protein LOC124484521 n=1 Tax=Hypomesus transpacificus TaxID=137520 RepID=UPI001F079105|nr:uncharacterized protein LOC124484521 [Hypomesus transpacificus]
MLVLCVAAVLGLLSAGQAAPLTCEALVKPLENTSLEMLLGKWMLIGDSSTVPGANTAGKMLLHNVWVEVTPTSDSNTVTSVQIQKILNRCQSIRINITLENNALQIVKPLRMTGVVLNTDCPDCIVIHSKYNLAGQTLQGLMVMSKRREVTSDELDSFKKQVECLSLPPPLILGSLSDLCPHPDSPTDGQLTADITEAFEGEQRQEIFKLLDKIMSIPGGMVGFMERITSSLRQNS